MDSAGVDGNIGLVLHGRSKADEVECRRKFFVFHGYHDSAFVFGLTLPLQPRRLIIAPAADGCKRLLGGCLLESQRFACSKEANRLLQTPGLCLLALGGFDPADIPSPM